MSQAALAQIPGLAEGFRGISAPFASLAGQAQRVGNTPLDTALLRQYAGQAAGFRQADPGITALAQQLSTQFGGSLTPAQVSSLAQEIARSGRRAGEEVSPVRSNVLGLLGDVSRGEIPQAVQGLTAGSTTAERDMLERQFARAQEDVLSRSGLQGGALARSQADLGAARALSLGQLEARQGDIERQLAQNLLGVAVQQGLAAPEQLQQALAASGQLELGAGGLALQEQGLRADSLTRAAGIQQAQRALGLQGVQIGRAHV